jgi:hypothetical protein
LDLTRAIAVTEANKPRALAGVEHGPVESINPVGAGVAGEIIRSVPVKF